jgi:hypothetical protein
MYYSVPRTIPDFEGPDLFSNFCSDKSCDGISQDATRAQGGLSFAVTSSHLLRHVLQLAFVPRAAILILLLTTMELDCRCKEHMS